MNKITAAMEYYDELEEYIQEIHVRIFGERSNGSFRALQSIEFAAEYKAKYEQELNDSLKHGRELTGLMLKAALSGSIGAPIQDTEGDE